MSTDVSRKPRAARRAAAVLVPLLVLGLVAALAFVLIPRSEKTTVTVDFDRTVSLYEGSKVRILGVDVGTVDSITPRGTTVRVRMSWDASYDVPADAMAAIVSPSVVGDRFVQLTPAYAGGAKMPDGAHLDQTRTATPTELDETYAALSEIAEVLGPEGVNADGSLSKLLSTSADNLDGKGVEIRRSIEALSKLTTTADGSKDELFSSMEKIERFVGALEKNDASVRSFNSSLAAVSDVLSGERDDLQAALRELATALGQVQGYVSDNRKALRKNVDGLADVTESLAKQRTNLAKILEQGPKALSNLAAAYNPTTGTIDTRASLVGKDGTFSMLTEPTFVYTYCVPAQTQNPRYAEACRALLPVVTWLAAQAEKTGAKTGNGGSNARSGSDAELDDAASDDLAALMGVA